MLPLVLETRCHSEGDCPEHHQVGPRYQDNCQPHYRAAREGNSEEGTAQEGRRRCRWRGRCTGRRERVNVFVCSLFFTPVKLLALVLFGQLYCAL